LNLLVLSGLQMHAVKKAVYGGRQDDTNGGNKNDPAEQGIKGGKQFSRCRCNFHYRSHTAEDHAGIVQRVYPADMRGKVIACRTDYNTDQHNARPEKETPEYSFSININRGQWLVFGFKQHGGFSKYKRFLNSPVMEQ